ncbi:unnamed protein product, partial [Symbiodinium microadriaticum]
MMGRSALALAARHGILETRSGRTLLSLCFACGHREGRRRTQAEHHPALLPPQGTLISAGSTFLGWTIFLAPPCKLELVYHEVWRQGQVPWTLRPYRGDCSGISGAIARRGLLHPADRTREHGGGSSIPGPASHTATRDTGTLAPVAAIQGILLQDPWREHGREAAKGRYVQGTSDPVPTQAPPQSPLAGTRPPRVALVLEAMAVVDWRDRAVRAKALLERLQNELQEVKDRNAALKLENKELEQENKADERNAWFQEQQAMVSHHQRDAMRPSSGDGPPGPAYQQSYDVIEVYTIEDAEALAHAVLQGDEEGPSHGLLEGPQILSSIFEEEAPAATGSVAEPDAERTPSRRISRAELLDDLPVERELKELPESLKHWECTPSVRQHIDGSRAKEWKKYEDFQDSTEV